MDAMMMLDWGIKIGCTLVTLIIVFRYKNQILELFREVALRDPDLMARDVADIRGEVERLMDRVIGNE